MVGYTCGQAIYKLKFIHKINGTIGINGKIYAMPLLIFFSQ